MTCCVVRMGIGACLMAWMRLVIQRQPPRGCTSEETRRNVEERRQAATLEAVPAGVKRLRLG